MLEFFIISSFWWWGLTGVFLIALIWGSLRESGVFLFFDLLVYASLLQIAFGAPILKSIVDHPIKALLYFVGYFAVGTVWSFFKWYMKVKKYVKEHNAEKQEFHQTYRQSVGKQPVEHAWKDYMHKPRKPQAKEEKATISYWIGYWPISAVVFFFEDFFTKIIETITDMFQGIYTRIENKVYTKLD